MLKIGVTGGLGAGKTTVASLFAQRGAPIVDTDEISHELTGRDGAAIPLIRESFGEAVFKADGSLDRAALRSQVLADDGAKRRLEAILHPLIREEAERRLAGLKAPYVLIVVPLLVETGAYFGLLDRVLVVDCSEETQVQRALARGGWSEAEIRAMMARQASRKARLGRADDVIDTDCRLDALAERVAALDRKYRLPPESPL
jgi:dephospho-CoA kinase